jgi:outer membrane protein, multidrug efflux system
MPELYRRARLCRCACLALLPLFFSACYVGPAYHRPDPPLPTAYRTQDIPSPSSPDPEVEPPQTEWWRGFGSPQLDDYIARAQSSNDDIAAAMARVREADAQARIAGAALLPNLTASAPAIRQRAQPGVSGAPQRPYDDYTPGLAASYEVDFWGGNHAAHNAALDTALASRFDRETVALTVMTSVALSYFEVLEYRDRLQVARQNRENAEIILKDLEFEAQVGTATALDVAQQATTVANVNAEIPPLQAQLRQSSDALAILIGVNPEQVDVNEGGLDGLTLPAIGAGLPSQLLARRPDVAESEAQLRAANANIGVARAAFFPTVNLTASGGYASTALNTLISPASTIWAISATLGETIFDNGARTGQYRYSRARYDELLSDYHKTVLTALGNVEDSLIAVQQGAELQLRLQDAADKARAAFEFAQLQFQAGTTNVLTMLNVETALFSAEDALVQGKFTHLQALVDLYQALGGGWRQEQAK